MTPIQQLYLGVGAREKTYVDDVFSTYLYTGNNTSRTLNVGIDFTTNGGATLIKNRTDSGNDARWCLFDTVRGNGYLLHPNDTDAQSQSTARQNNFSTTGFDVGSNENETNGDNDGIASWNFKKTKGFFDIIEYTGTGSNQTISHNLGCKPGMIWCKRKDGTSDWIVYHQSLGATQGLRLDAQDNASTNSNRWNNTEPTSTTFTIGNYSHHNTNGANYIAYLFAGGESDAATARSVDFDGNGDYLSLAATSDFSMGTGDFTIEAWVRTFDISHYGGIFNISNATGGISTSTTHTVAFDGANNRWVFWAAGAQFYADQELVKNQWYHVAYVKHSNVWTFYVNGTAVSTRADTTNYSYENLAIGGFYNTSYLWKGAISNFRIVKGTAVYTSSFKPPTEPLANITNTKLLCCNNSSTTGSTVTPGTITANGDPTAITAQPFDDPAGFKFGETGKHNIVKCGSYVGNGSADGPDVFVGFEPQFFLLKNSTNASSNWLIFDSMRGLCFDDVSSSTDEANIRLNTNDAEWQNNYLSPTSTGFKLTNGGSGWVNANGDKYIYFAIRRADGYVGKPIETGTSAFAMDTGNGSSAGPNFDANFDIDFALKKAPSSTADWNAVVRSTGKDFVRTNTSASHSSHSDNEIDFSRGWGSGSQGTNWQSWMWKRHTGLDVVVYKGTGTSGLTVQHSMNAVPQMLWIKNRTNSADWAVYHKDLAGIGYYLKLNTTAAQGYADDAVLNNTAPTANAITLGNSTDVNQSGSTYLALLFASINGISKVGVYNGATSNLTLDLGFQPRLFICKQISAGGSWLIFDSVRGMGSGNDSILQLDSNSGDSITNRLEATSSGITLYANTDDDVLPTNTSNKCIYYAHA